MMFSGNQHYSLRDCVCWEMYYRCGSSKVNHNKIQSIGLVYEKMKQSSSGELMDVCCRITTGSPYCGDLGENEFKDL